MSHYTNQEFDFINRTKIIIEQYDMLDISKDEKFEVTLLLNCLVGLLILPQQNWFDHLPTGHPISQKEWGIDEKHIGFIKKDEMKDVKNIARHIRNSIAHYNFKAFENKSEDITRIRFADFDRGKNPSKTFEADIPINCIRKFTTKLTETLMEQMKS